MPKSIYFTPGPSAVYYTLEEHVKKAFRQQVPEISHRSDSFKSIFQGASENLRALLNIPESHHVAFVSSATEVWERLIQNLVERESLHLVNGAFSKRFFEMSDELGRKPLAISSPAGQVPDTSDLPSVAPELVAITQNETSTGVSFPENQVKELRDKLPESVFALDVVSSCPIIPIDFGLIDTAYFSVQKCFGLPAGLGVWIYNDRCLDKAARLQEKGLSLGSYHNLLKLHASAIKNQTPETPNTLNIFLLEQVARDMNLKGLDMIRREAKYKAAVLYNLFETHSLLSPFVEQPELRSPTVAVAAVTGGSKGLIDHLKQHHMAVGSGYGDFKQQHIRIASFPTHSKEQIEMLADIITNFS